MTKEERAAEAQRIRESEAVIEATTAMRKTALDALASCEPTDADQIRKHQAMVRCVDDFLGELDAMICNGQPKKATGIV